MRMNFDEHEGRQKSEMVSFINQFMNEKVGGNNHH